MKILKTNLHVLDIDLLKIFMEANDLNIKISTHVVDGYKNFVALEYDDLDSDLEEKMTYLAIRNNGFESMLDDYLSVCRKINHLI